MSLSRLGQHVAAFTVVLMGLMSSIAVADPNGDSASGNILNFSQEIRFNASSTNTGFGATGNARVTFTANDPNITLAGEVTCLRVLAATPTTPALATIGVLVTHNNAPIGSFQSTVSSFIIFAKDSGKFSDIPDAAFASFSTAAPPPDGACPTPIDPGAADGSVTIHNEFP